MTSRDKIHNARCVRGQRYGDAKQILLRLTVQLCILQVMINYDDDDIQKGEVGEVLELKKDGKIRVEFKKGTWTFKQAKLTKVPPAVTLIHPSHMPACL